MTHLISIIVPNRNGAATIARCLEAVFASCYPNFEVIVVDDGSVDNSVAAIKSFPCRLFRLDRHSGASRARNFGAAQSNGSILFFTDADCVLKKDALSIAAQTISSAGPGVVVGGTYARTPYDNRYFSYFQSAFINYFETKRATSPDYIATHAMVIDARTFAESGGFAEHFLPILEDVELSHRLRRAGCKLLINPDIQVQHIFDYSLGKSLRNAIIKSMYWTIYSIGNGDLLADSGTASVELKINVLAWFTSMLLLLTALATGERTFLWFVAPVMGLNLFTNRGLFMAFYRDKGLFFSILAGAYYLFVYPVAVGVGSLAGIIRYRANLNNLRGST